MEYKKILVPVDGSEEGGRALEHAVYLSKISGAKLCLLHVVDLNRKLSLLERAWTGGGVPPEMKEKGYKILSDHTRRVPSEIQLSTVVEVGAPPDTILEVAKREEADVIVLGSRGLSPLETVVLGGVSHYVLHYASIPVLIVR